MEEVSNLKEVIKKLNIIVEKLESNRFDSCDHDFKRELPFGPRDNGEFYYKCKICGFQK